MNLDCLLVHMDTASAIRSMQDVAAMMQSSKCMMASSWVDSPHDIMEVQLGLPLHLLGLAGSINNLQVPTAQFHTLAIAGCLCGLQMAEHA